MNFTCVFYFFATWLPVTVDLRAHVTHPWVSVGLERGLQTLDALRMGGLASCGGYGHRGPFL